MEPKKNLRARKYTSPILEEVLKSLTEVELAQSRLRLTIAARIDDYRKERGLSKRQLAERLNRKPSVVTKWMSGIHNFTSDTLVEIAVALGVDVKDLQTYYNEENKVQSKICLQSFEVIPLIVPVTPRLPKHAGQHFESSTMLETILNKYTSYVA